MRGRWVGLVAGGVALSALAGCGGSEEPVARPTSNVSRTGGSAVSDLLTVSPTPSSLRTPKFDGHGANVDATMFGASWPFRIKSGRINCVPLIHRQLAVVFTADDRKTYALNATATKVAGAFDYLPAGQITVAGHQAGVLRLVHICAPTKLHD